MKIAVIGSRGLENIDIGKYLPENVTELVSGGARGIDYCVRQYAEKTGIPITEFIPDYKQYGKRAPLLRNIEIIKYADVVIALWDGTSRGTKFVIHNCEKLSVPIKVYCL